MSPVPRPDNTPAILSAIESTPTATDQEIATVLGLTRQRVAQVRKAQHGARPAGRPTRSDAAAEVRLSVRFTRPERAELEDCLLDHETAAGLLRDLGLREAARRRTCGAEHDERTPDDAPSYNRNNRSTHG